MKVSPIQVIVTIVVLGIITGLLVFILFRKDPTTPFVPPAVAAVPSAEPASEPVPFYPCNDHKCP